MENLELIAFEKWYGFYKLANNKSLFTEEDTAASIIRIKYAVEDFINEKKELCELLKSRGIVDNGISDSRITYTENSRMFIRRGISITKEDMTNEMFNKHIYNIVQTIIYDNIDLYFNAAELVLEADEIENIKSTASDFDDKDIIEKILKLLYLFRNSERQNIRINDIELFLEFSAKKTSRYTSSQPLNDIFKMLVKKELIHVDWTGCYSIVSEEKKRLKQMVKFLYSKVTTEEKNNFVFNIIRTRILSLIKESKKTCDISVDIDGNKIYTNESNFMLKIDNYTKENRDIRRGYYVVNTKEYKNVVFWYGKRILDIDDKAKHVIAFARAIDSLEISFKNDPSKMEFLKLQKSLYKSVLDDFKMEIEEGFKNGGYIRGGEDKKLEKFESIEKSFEYITSFLK